MKTVVASLFACAVLAHSPQLLAQASTPEVAAPKAATAVTPAESPAALEPGVQSGSDSDKAQSAQADAATADEAPPPDEKHDIGTSRLEGRLHSVEAERQSYSRFLPWLTVGVGAAVTAGSAALGIGRVLSCDGDCSTSAWIGLGVVAGTFIATVGAIWVVHANADVRELDSKQYQLQQEIERIRFSSNLPSKSDLQRSQWLSWRFAFR